MHKPRPTERELRAEAHEFKAEFAGVLKGFDDDRWVAPYQLWDKMLDLIYTGNMDAAWKLCDLSWPADRLGKDIFLQEFKKELATSEYFKVIMQLNHRTRAGHKTHHRL